MADIVATMSKAERVGDEFDQATKSYGLKETDRDFHAVKAGMMSVEIARLRERLAAAEHRLAMQTTAD